MGGSVAVLRPLVRGVAEADSWATDAHKTLNVPYDCGLAIVADRHALVTALSQSASYVIRGTALEPVEKTVEWSRRARGFGIWAVLRSLGRQGVDELVTGLHHNAVALGAALGTLPGVGLLHDVTSTQVTVAVGDDARTRAVVDHRRVDVDLRLPLEGAGRHPGLGQQLVDRRRRHRQGRGCGPSGPRSGLLTLAETEVGGRRHARPIGWAPGGAVQRARGMVRA